VAGIALTSLYTENGWLGTLPGAARIKVAFTPLGVVVALTFIGFRSWCAACNRYWRMPTGNWKRPHPAWAPRAGRYSFA